MSIAEKIVTYISGHPGTSFVELERIFEHNNFDYKGDRSIVADGYDNLILWSGWNNQAVSILNELMSSNKIIAKQSQNLIYLVDGKTLDFPLAKGFRSYKYPRWMPIEFATSK